MYDKFKKMNTKVLAISTDSAYSHKVFFEQSPLLAEVRYPLVSDRTQEISKAYRVLNDKEGAAYRSTIIINLEGIIVSKQVYPLEIGRNIYELWRVLQALQLQQETGEIIPAR